MIRQYKGEARKLVLNPKGCIFNNDIRDVFADRRANRLHPDEEVIFERHLDVCNRCHAYNESIR